MKEKKAPTSKLNKKSLKEEPIKPKVDAKPTKSKTKPLATSKEKPTIEHPPTIQEIEDIKEDILAQGLLNPYALILYHYMCKSSYEINVELVLSMRETWMKISKINQLILDELKIEQEM